MNTKVKILPKVTNFSIGVVTYFPGDIIDIPESLYSSGFMEKIEETPPTAKKPIFPEFDDTLPKVDVPIEIVALPIFTKDLKTESSSPKEEDLKQKPRKVNP